MTVSDVSPLFGKYTEGFGTGVSVIFDGCATGPSIKDQEHVRRSLQAGHVAHDRQINKDTKNVSRSFPV